MALGDAAHSRKSYWVFDNCGTQSSVEGNVTYSRRLRSFLSSILILLAVVPLVFSKDKHRDWQDGILMDSSTEKGTRLLGDANSLVTLRNDVIYYQIDTAKTAYFVARTLRSRKDKPLDVTVNGLVRFAIDGSTCYLRDEEGKEHKLSVETKAAR
jgi:hypothetical protein